MKIVVGFDGSNVAKDALRLAIERSGLYDAAVDVVKVVAQSPSLVYEEIRKIEQSLENEVREICGDKGVTVNTLAIITHQTPGEAVVEYADEHKAAEIVIGIRRRSKVGKLVFGSTAQHIIINANCPVVSIR